MCTFISTLLLDPLVVFGNNLFCSQLFRVKNSISVRCMFIASHYFASLFFGKYEEKERKRSNNKDRNCHGSVKQSCPIYNVLFSFPGIVVSFAERISHQQ